MGSTEEIQTELNDGILTLRFNRPEKKNALNLRMYQALSDGLREADEDEAIRCILIAGSDDCFTSGNDLADFMSSPPVGADSPVLAFLGAISRCRKPVVAAVNGAAVGVGVTMLLHCDLVYAGESASFQLPFVNLGLCPEAGSTLLFPRLMGHQRAAELLLWGEHFSAAKALEVGIINAVLPDGEVLAAARAKALQVAAQPAASVRLTKALLKQEYEVALEETILLEAVHFVKRLQSPEAGEALQAFMERRKPEFARFA
jgi:enoyl-CoA hydratase/carnithine racemase